MAHRLASAAAVVFGLISKLVDQLVVNLGFDTGCDGLKEGSRGLALIQSGQVQRYLRLIAFSLVALVVLVLWEGRK